MSLIAHRSLAIAGAIVGVVVAASVEAQVTSTWTGLAAPDNNWTSAGNWDSGVPDSFDTALFNGAGNGNTNISLGAATQPINTVLFQSGAAAYTLGESVGDTLSFDSNGALFVVAGVTTAQTIDAAVQTNGLLEVHNSVSNGLSGVPGAGLVGLTLGSVNIGGGGHLIVDNGIGGVINATTVLDGNITETPGQPGRVTLRGSTAGIPNNTNFYINGNNTYTGGTTVQVNTGTNGGIYIGSDTAFGTGKITNLQQNNVPEYRAENGSRTIANDIDLGSGINFNGTNSFLFTGDFAIISSTSRTLRNKITGGAVTIGDVSGSSIFYLGNPLANGGDDVGRTLVLAPEAGSTMTVNAILKDAADPNVVGNTARGSLQFGGMTPGGIVLMNSLSTYTGTTLIGGGANGIVQFSRDYNAGDPSGPFGLGAITTNNNGTLQPKDGNRTLANSLVISDNAMNSFFQVSNSTGDTSGLTVTGPVTMETAGRSIRNNFAATGGILTLGSAASPSTFTLPTAAGQTLTIEGTGRTVINHTIQDSPGIAANVSVSNSSTTTFNGPQNTNGNLTVSGAATVIMNGNRTGSGNITLTGSAPKLFVHGAKTGGGAVTVGTTSTLSGTGSLDGAVTNNGTIAPGTETLAPDTLTLTGNVTNNANSHWLIGLDGATSGKLTIGGNLDLSALDSLDVIGTGSGSSWVIATYAGALTGTFDNVTPGYTVDYGTLNNSQITLMVPGLAGDFNDDGKVDAADYVVWRKNETANSPLPNDNGLTTQADRFNLWRANFGNPMGSGSSSGTAGSVPEPATMLLLLVAIAGLPAARSRRRS
jgi:hypothetical protein